MAFNDPALELNLPKAFLGLNDIVITAEELAERVAKRQGIDSERWAKLDAEARRRHVATEAKSAKLSVVHDSVTAKAIQTMVDARNAKRAEVSAERRAAAVAG